MSAEVPRLLMVRTCPWGRAPAARAAILEKWPAALISVLDQERHFWVRRPELGIEELFIQSDARMPEPIRLDQLRKRYSERLRAASRDGVVIAHAGRAPSGLLNVICAARWIANGAPVWMAGSDGALRIWSPVDTAAMLARDGLRTLAQAALLAVLAPLVLLPRALFYGLIRPRIADSDSTAQTTEEDGLTIIVPTHNTCDMTARNVASLVKNCPGARVIVVDDCSTDGTAKRLGREFPRCAVVRLDRNLGFAAAVNAGARAARTRHIAVLNSDTALDADVFAPLVGHLKQHPECGIVSCRILTADGAVYKNLTRGEQDWRVLLDRSMISIAWQHVRWVRRELNRLLVLEESAYDRVITDLTGVSFALAVMRRSDFFAAGMLDTRYFMYFEDADFCLQMRRMGKQIHYLPVSGVTHVGKGSSSPAHAFRRFCRARTLFFRKHGHPLLAAASDWLGTAAYFWTKLEQSAVSRQRSA